MGRSLKSDFAISMACLAVAAAGLPGPYLVRLANCGQSVVAAVEAVLGGSEDCSLPAVSYLARVLYSQ